MGGSRGLGGLLDDARVGGREGGDGGDGMGVVVGGLLERVVGEVGGGDGVRSCRDWACQRMLTWEYLILEYLILNRHNLSLFVYYLLDSER